MRVQLTEHAISRWHEYKGNKTPKEISKIASRHIAAKLKCGLKIDHTGAGHVQIAKDLWAAVQITALGWKVITFHRGEYVNGRERNEEEGNNTTCLMGMADQIKGEENRNTQLEDVISG